ncbi:MAG: 3-phosphoshikimate 1-carboxyvinyltransferase [Planctomycetes bacterium]|nr:3-phosphoshikimate 1-carboxyvinyltransferase [Planctomycetota bacterium]
MRMSAHAIRPITEPLDAVVRVPGSKSLTNRALLAAALAQGRSILSNALFADDTERLLVGLEALGIALETDRAENRVEITGCGGHLPASDADIDCGESGSMLRFFTALCATAVGRYRLWGRGRLHQRPIAPLVDALRQMGTLVEFEEKEGCAPLIVHGRALVGGQIEVDGSASSQFTSALLLASPYARSDVMLTVTGTPISEPYVRMTGAVMRAFGISLATDDYRKIIVPAPQMYEATNYEIEPDASSAGYFLAAAAICGGRVRIEGLGRTSCQGDLRLTNVLQQMGCTCRVEDGFVELERRPDQLLRGKLEFDLGDMPDAAPTVAVLALFADGPVRIRNVAHLQQKESARLSVLATQLGALGAEIDVHSDGLTVEPPAEISPCTIDPSGDHRMAMAFALVGLSASGVAIADPGCVSKSFPGYFALLASLSDY